MALKKIAFTMTPVTDMKRARAFYEGILGLKMTETFMDGNWIEYDLPEGGCLALAAGIPGTTPSASMGSSIAFEVDDITKTLADLKAKDVKVAVDLFETPVCRMAVILDSEGNAVSIHQAHE